MFAVRRVLKHVELGRREGDGTFSAHKAVLVVAPGKATRRVFDRLANNRLRAPAAVAFAGRLGLTSI